MKKHTGISAILTCMVTVGLGASQAKAPSGNWEHLFEGSPILAGKDGAWIVQEPRVVASGPVESMAFGPGANELIFVSRAAYTATAKDLVDLVAYEKPRVGLRLTIFNHVTGASKRLPLPNNLSAVSGIDWDIAKRIAVLHAKANGQWFTLLVDAASGAFYETEAMQFETLIPSEVPTIAVLRIREFGEAKVAERIRTVDFSVNPPQAKVFDLPAKFGEPIFLSKNLTLIGESQGAGRASYAELSFSDGSVRPWKVPSEEPKILMERFGTAKPNISTEFRQDPEPGLWLRTTPGLRSELRLSKQADLVEVNDKVDKVLFRAHGAVFLSELTPFDLDSALKALMAHAKTNAVMMAKQAGTALHIYGADYDDMLPISGASARESVYPYIKSGKILDSVIWTNVTGQNLGKIENPATYELGYVPGPGGRAIIYADGHVGWRVDP